MKKHPVLWVLRNICGRIPAVAALILARVGYALFSVFFALGSRAVIDSAVAGVRGAFVQACLRQGGIIAVILLCLTVSRHLRDRLAADLEKDWKQRLLHGDYTAVSQYHSAELLNRLNQDVTKVNEGILTVFPAAAAMLTQLIAAVVVLGVLDARFTAVIIVVGLIALAAGVVILQKK